VNRSIYTLWRQVWSTSTPSSSGLTHAEQADARLLSQEPRHGVRPRARRGRRVNVTSRSTTSGRRSPSKGATVEAHPDTMLGYRDRQTARCAGSRPTRPLLRPNELDRRVVAKDQIRTSSHVRDRLAGGHLPRPKEGPKTLIFAKDDSHARTSSRSCADEFGRGNAFTRRSPTRSRPRTART